MTSGPDRSVPYDAWLLWSVRDVCNLGCLYCPTGLKNRGLLADRVSSSERLVGRRMVRLTRNVLKFGISTSLVLYRQRKTKHPNRISPIDIDKLLTTLERTGKVFRVGFTGGGEPLLIPNIVDACVAISQRHFLSFNTNLTSPRARQIAERLDPTRVSFHASLHLKELERLRLAGRFVEHYRLLNDRGFAVLAEAVGHPSLMPEVESYRSWFGDRDVDLHFGPYKGEYRGKTYPESYTDDELKQLGLRPSARKLFQTKGRLCNAGYNAVTAGPEGLVSPCFDLAGEHLGHVYTAIHLGSDIRECPVDVCTCPLNTYDEPLFRLALWERRRFGSKAPAVTAAG